MTFLEVANDRFVYYVVAGVLLVVLAILLNFLRLALKRANEMGIPKEDITTTIRTTILTSIGPSFSILLPFLTLMALLGAPWSWLRLSVIGSTSMEIYLSDMSMTAAGFKSLGVETSGQAFCLQALAVAITCSPTMIVNLLFTKKYSTAISNAKNSKYYGEINAATGALFLGVMCYLGMNIVISNVPAANYVPVAVLLTTIVVGVIGDTIIEKYKLKKIAGYTFAIYLIIGLASAIFWDKIF